LRFALALFVGLVAGMDEDEQRNAMKRNWCGSVDCYSVLGLQPEAESSAIKDAFRRLSKEKHPDVCPDCDPKEMQAINNAYGILSTPKEKETYDQVLKIKQSVDSPRESPIFVFIIVFALSTYVTMLYKQQRYKAIKLSILQRAKVKRWFNDKHPGLLPKELDRKARKKAAKKKGGEEEAEVDLSEVIPDDVLNACIEEFNLPSKGWAGQKPDLQSAAMDVAQFPVSFLQWAIFQIQWLINYQILGGELSNGDKLYLLLQANDLDQRCWDRMTFSQKSEYLKKDGEWSGLYDVLKAEEDNKKRR